MKAVILCAGRGHRLKQLTESCPKTLLEVGGMTILDRMMGSLLAQGIRSFVFVVGYRREQIEQHVQKRYLQLASHFVINERFAETNTGYSLFLARQAVGAEEFVKLDGDVVFENKVLQRLWTERGENGIAIDRSVRLGEEEVKVLVDDSDQIQGIGKDIPPKKAVGESIGIERISGCHSSQLFAELETIFECEKKFQEYYELAYHRLIQQGMAFRAIDITGLKWNEIDDARDLARARELF